MAVVELVVDQEALSVLAARVDVDLGESIMQSWLLDALLIAGLEPLSEHAELAARLEVLDELVNRAHSNGQEKLLDVVLVAIELEKGAEDLRRGI